MNVVMLPLKDVVNQTLEQYESEKSRLSGDITNLNKDLTRVTLKLETASQQLQEHNQGLRQSKKDKENLLGQISTLTTSKTELENEIVRLKTENATYDELSNEILRLNTVIEQKKKEERELTVSVDGLAIKRQSLSSEISTLETRIRILKTEHEGMDRDIKENERILREIQAERERKERAEEKAKKYLEELNKNQRSLGQYIRPIQEKLDREGIKLDFIAFIKDI
jgi:chromosome segregation ATPase